MTKLTHLPLLLLALLVSSGETLLRNGASLDERETSALSPPQQQHRRRMNGEKTCFTGFIMDTFCIRRGRLLDNPSVQTLIGPEHHSVHCLVDIDQCVTSGYEVLGAPATAGGLYTRKAKFDAAGNKKLVTYARTIGEKKGSNGILGCDTCFGMGDVLVGLRATVVGQWTGEGGTSKDDPGILAVEEFMSDSVACDTLIQVDAGEGDGEGTGEGEGTDEGQDDEEVCTQRRKDKFVFKPDKMKSCKWLDRRSSPKICKICKKAQSTAKEVCCRTCADCVVRE